MSEDDRLSFDLIDRPWLLVRSLAGHTEELSLVDTFRRAHDLVGLVGEVPTQVFALTRLLLAVLHRAVAGPRDLAHWQQLWRDEMLPSEDIQRYLHRYRERFDLFHPKTPFLQVAGLHTAKHEVSELAKIIADVPNGRPFFTTRLGPVDSLPFGEAARWLVHCHAFDPSGIKSGAVGDNRVKGGRGYPIGTGWSGLLGGVLPQGATLRETLLLNLIAGDYDEFESREGDAPVWERDPVGPAEEKRGPSGPLDLFIWQARRVRLAVEGDRVVGVLICNGDRLTPQNQHVREPHTAWRRSQAQEKKLGKPLVYMPLEHDPKRMIWRGLQSLLPWSVASQGRDAAERLSPLVLRWVSYLCGRGIEWDYPVWLRTIGMTYGSNNSTTEDIVDDALALHAVLLSRDPDAAGELVEVALSCVAASEAAAKALGSLAQNVAQAGGKRPPKKPGAPEPGDIGPRTRATELAYAELDSRFRDWLAKLGPQTDAVAAKTQWHRTSYGVVSGLGRELLRAASATAWVGRTVNGRLVTSAHADLWFRRELSAALPLAHVDASAGASA